jgi:hypothetical protein
LIVVGPNPERRPPHVQNDLVSVSRAKLALTFDRPVLTVK